MDCLGGDDRQMAPHSMCCTPPKILVLTLPRVQLCFTLGYQYVAPTVLNSPVCHLCIIPHFPGVRSQDDKAFAVIGGSGGLVFLIIPLVRKTLKRFLPGSINYW
jgi:hypothetical protein